MTKSKAEQPVEPPIVLRENSIVNGEFFRAGTPLPFTRVEDLPESLKPLLADGSEEFYHPSERLIYDNPQSGPDPGVVYQPLSGQQWVRRQAGQAASISQEQIYAEEQVEVANKLSPDVEDALQAKHDRLIGKALAQAQYDRDAMDRLHESLAAEAENRTVVFYVKRGSVHVRCEKAKCKPGENVFTKDESGEWSFAGVIDSDGAAPSQPIVT